MPKIAITDSALKAFQSALGDADGEALHLKIDARFQNDLYFAPREPNTLELQLSGLVLYLDAASARRADGMSIDFVDGENAGFKIDNPNQPASVKQLSAPELKAMLDRGAVELFDVRPAHEQALARVAVARSLDEAGQEYLFFAGSQRPDGLHLPPWHA